MSEHAKAHRRIADVVDAIEAMGVDVEDSGIDYAGAETTEATIELTMTGDLVIPTADELEATRETRDDARERVAELQEERDEAVKEVKRLNEQLADVPSADEVADLEEEIADLEDERDTAIERADQLESQLVDGVDREKAAEEFLDTSEREDSTDDAEDERNCPWPDCDYSGNERGLAIHIGRAHDGEEPDVVEFARPVDDEEVERLQDALDEDVQDDVDEDGEESDADLDDPERATLEALRECGETTVGQLAEDFDVSTGTIHGRLHRLREHDLIAARPDPDDGRRKLYRPASSEVPDESDGSEDVEEEPDGDDAESTDDASSGTDPDREQFVLDILDEEGPMRVQELREYITDEFDVGDGAARYTHEEMAKVGDVARWADPDDSSMSYYGLPEQKPERVGEPGAYYPRDCGSCGATLENGVEEAVHRTEEHGKPQGSLGHLEQGEFEAIVEDADDVNAIVDELPFEFEKVLRLLGVYGLEDVVGGDVELSDVTDFDFDGVDEPEEETESDDGPDVQETTSDPADPPTAAKICMRNDLDRDEVVDAIAHAQGVFHVRRDLGLPADVADSLLNELGFLEELKGTGHVGRERAKEAVHKQVPRSIAADGGEQR